MKSDLMKIPSIPYQVLIMPSIFPKSKLPYIEGSIFSAVARTAKKHNAINLAQGFPDFKPDQRLLNALSDTVDGNYHQYSLPEGLETLRYSITRIFYSLYKIKLSADKEVTITAGATQAIFAAVSSLIHAGEEVIFLSPAFESYAPAIVLAGAIPICVELKSPNFEIDWEEVERNMSACTRMIIVNSPHNPSGRCWTKSDVNKLADLADRYNLFVLSDEVYHNIVFEQQHITALSDERLRERTVVVGSLSKTMHVTGWRIGYSIATASITHEIRKILQFNTYAAPTPLQQAMAVVLNDDEHNDLIQLLRLKRDYFLRGLSGSRFSFTPASGGYFQLIDYSMISELPNQEFSNYLIEIHGVAGLPISGFGQQYAKSRLLRFCFAKKEETLDAATAILRKL